MIAGEGHVEFCRWLSDERSRDKLAAGLQVAWLETHAQGRCDC